MTIEEPTKNDLGVEEVTALAEWTTKLIEANKSAYSQGYADGMKAQAEPKTDIKLTNSEWVDFLSKQFDISRTSAKEMLHVMMSVKREDNFKKQFSGRK